MNSVINWLIVKTWKSDYFKSWVLAQARHVATALGTALVLHGFANKEMSEDIVGFIVAAASFYLAALDVKVVDGKIRVALNTMPPTAPVIPVTVEPLPDVETKK